jgi:hypothetical protein
MNTLLARATIHFERLNKADGLTDADKKQLKDAYLQTYFEPYARELLKAKLASRARRLKRLHAQHHS